MGEKERRSVTVRETGDGIIIEIRGDKHELKRKKEAIEAFFEFRDKFWEAFGPKHGPLAAMHERHRRRHGRCDVDEDEKDSALDDEDEERE